MAKRKKRRSTRSRSTARKQQNYPGWLWMLFGLAIGLSVAFAMYVKDNEPERPQAAAVPSSIDDNGESNIPASATPEPDVVEEKERRFTFYDLLPAAEFVVPEGAPDAEEQNTQPEAVVEPGVYVLQAGAFSTNNDAERRRAELGMQGIESHTQLVTVNDRDYFRVYIGPTEDLDELNLQRSKLRAANIDVLRIRLSD